MTEHMAERVRNWKIEECEFCMGIGGGVLTVTASLHLDGNYTVNHRRDVDIFMESLAKGPVTVLPSEAVNKLLDESIEMREKLEELQGRLDEIRDAVRVLRGLEAEE